MSRRIVPIHSVIWRFLVVRMNEDIPKDFAYAPYLLIIIQKGWEWEDLVDACRAVIGSGSTAVPKTIWECETEDDAEQWARTLAAREA